MARAGEDNVGDRLVGGEKQVTRYRRGAVSGDEHGCTVAYGVILNTTPQPVNLLSLQFEKLPPALASP